MSAHQHPFDAYAEFERNAAQVEAYLSLTISNLRAAYALDPTSVNHHTQIQAGILAEFIHFDPRMLASLLVGALDKLSQCSGRHLRDYNEPSTEDWEWKT